MPGRKSPRVRIYQNTDYAQARLDCYNDLEYPPKKQSVLALH